MPRFLHKAKLLNLIQTVPHKVLSLLMATTTDSVPKQIQGSHELFVLVAKAAASC